MKNQTILQTSSWLLVMAAVSLLLFTGCQSSAEHPNRPEHPEHPQQSQPAK